MILITKFNSSSNRETTSIICYSMKTTDTMVLQAALAKLLMIVF